MNYKRVLPWLALFGLCGAAYVVSTPPETKQEKKQVNIVDITPETINNYQDIVIHFYVNGCRECAFVADALETVAEKYNHRLTFGKAHFQKNTELLDKFNINPHPAVIFIKGGKPVELATGRRSAQELEEIILMHYVTQ